MIVPKLWPPKTIHFLPDCLSSINRLRRSFGNPSFAVKTVYETTATAISSNNKSRSQPVWPDDEIKRCLIFSNIAQKGSQIIFYIKGVLFKIAQKFTRIFGLLLQENLLLRRSKNRPIWSHWSQLMSVGR